MARQFGWALALVVLVGSTAPAAAVADACETPRVQDNERKQGRSERRAWWKDERDVATLGITSAQSAEIEQIYREWAQKARPLREELHRLEKDLDRTAAANTEDVTVFARMVENVEDRRAELNKLRWIMLYRMHRVLSREQYARLKEMAEAQRKKDGDRRH